MAHSRRHRVVVIGGGFGGLEAALALRRANVSLTLIDRRNFHLFQPLLYQVATGGLSAGDIAYPLRAAFRDSPNVRVLLDEVTDLDLQNRTVIVRSGRIEYDTLVLAAGSTHAYFDNDEWSRYAPGLKTIEDANLIRRRVLGAFEAAEREDVPARRRPLLNFVIVGAGSTGVELAGALAELSRETLRKDFRNIDPAESSIVLLDMSRRILPSYPPELSEKARRGLARLGITVRTGVRVDHIDPDRVRIRSGDVVEEIPTKTVLWSAGVKASPLASLLHERAGADVDETGRLEVGPDCTIEDYPDVFVIGDMARFIQDGKPLPALAAVAKEQGRYVAKSIERRLDARTLTPFRYTYPGNLTVIGRHRAVADLGRLRFNGFLAWLLWLVVHLLYLVGFQNRLLVAVQWAFHYFTFNRNARVISEYDSPGGE